MISSDMAIYTSVGEYFRRRALSAFTSLLRYKYSQYSRATAPHMSKFVFRHTFRDYCFLSFMRSVISSASAASCRFSRSKKRALVMRCISITPYALLWYLFLAGVSSLHTFISDFQFIASRWEKAALASPLLSATFRWLIYTPTHWYRRRWWLFSFTRRDNIDIFSLFSFDDYLCELTHTYIKLYSRQRFPHTL